MNKAAAVGAVHDDVCIRVSGLGKAFPIARSGGVRQGFSLFNGSKAGREQFWALQDVSFDVRAGRALGILGLNGAGKSTLLGLLAATMQPSAGTLDVKGRVQLLQLGAGFQHDLSGRQNVVSHARVRGVSGAETARRVAYVEEFADIGPFFDQPMKMYSSGMASRVAFGNAFAIDPEILIVDEALAVGDAVFVNKCFRKIQDVRERGTTLLFTSHSSDAVLKLCEDGIVLNRGRLVASGTAQEAVRSYATIVLGSMSDPYGPHVAATNETAISILAEDAAEDASIDLVDLRDDVDRLASCPLYNKAEVVFGTGGARIVACDVRVNGRRAEKRAMQLGTVLELRVRVFFETAVQEPDFGFSLNDARGAVFYGINQKWRGDALMPAEAGESRVFRATFPTDVGGGSWFMTLTIADGTTVLQQREAAFHLEVFDIDHSYVGQGWLDLAFGQENPAS